MRRRTAICLAEVPRPMDVETEVLYAIDARQKLQVAIEAENQKRETAENEFAGTVAREIHGSQTINVELVYQREVAAKSSAERSKQRIEALQSILARINNRIDQLKCDAPEAVNAVLTKRIDALERTLSEREGAEKDLEDQIKLLKYELNKLPKAAAKKAS